MKRVIAGITMFMILAAGIFCGCNKSGKVGSSVPVVEKESVELPSVMSGGSSCHCAVGQISCQSNCWLSDCCICWNPNTSDGGCGCWLGVALCKIESKKKDAAVYASHVKVYEERMQEVFDFLDRIPVNTQTIREKYKLMVGKVRLVGKSGGGESYRLVPGDEYASFAKAYMEITKNLNVRDQDRVSAFIESRKSGIK